MSLLTSDLPRRSRQVRFNPIRGLSPEKLAAALDRFDAGYLRDAALLWEVIEDRDDVLQIVCAKRRKRVSRQPWEVLAIDDSAAAKAQVETVKAFLNSLTVTDASDENVRGGFRLLVRQMMNGVFHKYAVHEIVWSTRGKVTAELRFAPLYFFSNVAGRLAFVGPEGGSIEGKELNEQEWLITTGDSALMKAASICYIFKRLSLQDWLAYSMKFGIPGIHGETPATKGTQEFTDFVNALEDFANEWITATNQGAKINLIEVSKTGDAPFEPMVERMDRRMTSLVVGSDLSTMSRDNGVGSNPQQADGDQMLEDDCELISETLQMQLIRPLLAYVHGGEPLAYVKITPPAPEDTKLDIEVDQFLIDNGGELDAADTFERYNRAPAASMAKDAVLKKAAAPAPTPPSPNSLPQPSVPAENDGPLLRNALARTLGVVPEWLAPLAQELTALETKAADGQITDAELLAFVEAAAQRLPELFSALNISALADQLEAAMGTAVISGVASAFRRHPSLAQAA